MNNLYARAFRSTFLSTLAMAALLFIPAGTIDYWQAWAFLIVFVGASSAIGIFLAFTDPELLKRRMRAGPAAEKEKSQKIIMMFAMIGFIALLVFPALDHRFMWSPVPPALSLAGDALVVLGFVITFVVLRANRYAASTIQIAEDQTVVSTGPYALVRHPMYAGVLPLLVGTPLALGSWWGLFTVALVVPALIWRLLDEERFLARNLPGYAEYRHAVKYRLLPFVW